MLARVPRNLAVKIKCLLLDRAFFNVPVVALLLKRERLPFLMPVRSADVVPKASSANGPVLDQRQRAGWYKHTLKSKTQQVTLSVCVAYRTHRNRKDGKHVQQKLLFGAWGVKETPHDIRERYRKRFGIESS